MALLLRIKTKTGQHTVRDLKLDSTVDDLRQNVSKISEIPTEALRILKDYPPKPLDLSNGGASLEDLKFKSGDVLIVEEDPSAKRKREAAANDKVMEDFAAQGSAVQGFLLREEVPANNSCLFTSVHYVMEGGKLDLAAAPLMRQLIASVVMSDPDTYNEAFLEKSNQDYCNFITSEDSWGGAIELSILSKYYGMEIAAIDTQSTRLDRYGEDKNYKERVLLIYNGIHYDPIKMESVTTEGGPCTTKFSTSNTSVLAQLEELAVQAKASRQFTDVQNFKLRCMTCNKALTGEAEAQSHASKTGHQNFGEY